MLHLRFSEGAAKHGVRKRSGSSLNERRTSPSPHPPCYKVLLAEWTGSCRGQGSSLQIMCVQACICACIASAKAMLCFCRVPPQQQNSPSILCKCLGGAVHCSPVRGSAQHAGVLAQIICYCAHRAGFSSQRRNNERYVAAGRGQRLRARVLMALRPERAANVAPAQLCQRMTHASNHTNSMLHNVLAVCVRVLQTSPLRVCTGARLRVAVGADNLNPHARIQPKVGTRRRTRPFTQRRRSTEA